MRAQQPTDTGFVRSFRVSAGGADAYPLPPFGDIHLAAQCQTLQEVQGVLGAAQFNWRVGGCREYTRWSEVATRVPCALHQRRRFPAEH